MPRFMVLLPESGRQQQAGVQDQKPVWSSIYCKMQRMLILNVRAIKLNVLFSSMRYRKCNIPVRAIRTWEVEV